VSGSEFLHHCSTLAIALMSLAFVLTIIRFLRGPTLPDRVLALDLLTVLAIGYIAVVSVRTGLTLYLDIGIALSLVGLLSTLAFSRYILFRAGVTKASTAPAPRKRS